jgi:hypothetical protein
MSDVDLPVWYELDWRFMLPAPDLGRVYVASESAGEAAKLRAVGVPLVDDPRGATLALVGASPAGIFSLEQALQPGTLVRVAIGRERSWAIADELRDRGWDVLGRIWALGGIARTVAYVDVDDKRAVMYACRGRRPSSLRARLALVVRLVLGRAGLWRSLCHEGFVFARTPV